MVPGHAGLLSILSITGQCRGNRHRNFRTLVRLALWSKIIGEASLFCPPIGTVDGMDKPKHVTELFIDQTDYMTDAAERIACEIDELHELREQGDDTLNGTPIGELIHAKDIEYRALAAEVFERNERIDAWRKWVNAQPRDDDDEPAGNDPDRDKWRDYWASVI